MSAKKTTGLGRGFAALIPDDFDKSLLADDQERIQKLAVGELDANPDQPRQHFDKEGLEQLATSIKTYGILQPLVVTPRGTRYSIVAGERRWRAAQLAGLVHVPVIVRTTRELEQLEIALVENVQRVDLEPLEQALSIERLHQQFTMKYEAIAERLGKAPSTVTNIVRLLQLPDAARAALHKKEISEGHARSILALKDFPEKQTELLSAIKKHGWSVRQAERFVTSVKEGYREAKLTRERMKLETPDTKRISKKIGAPVQIRRTARGGKLEISFKSDDELAHIIRTLS